MSAKIDEEARKDAGNSCACLPGWCDSGAGQLVVSEPLQDNPWESFWTHSIFGLIFCVGLPFVLQVSYEFQQEHADSSKKEVMNMSGGRVSPAYFMPVGLLAASVIAFVAFWIRLASKPFMRNLVYKETSANIDAVFPCLRLSKAEKVDASSPEPDTPSRNWSCRRLLSLTIFVLICSALPIFAWLDRAVWEAVMADVFYDCKHVCEKADESSKRHDHGSLSYRLHHACRKSGILKAKGSDAGWDEIGALPEVTLALDGYMRPEVKKHRCLNILKVEETPYITTLIKRNNFFSAFDSKLKMHDQIGVLEVYGAALGISFFIMMFGSRLALRSKLRSLNNAKKELMLTQLLITPGMSQKYMWLFQRLHEIHGRFDDKAQYWVTQVLERGTKDDQRNAKWSEDVFNVGQEDDEDGRLDEHQAMCSPEKITSVLLGCLFAAGHVAIPGLFRMSAVATKKSGPFFGDAEMAPALILGTVVEFVFNALWFGKFVHCFYGQDEKLQQTVAFDCMWRFPGENPVQTTLREQHPLLDEIIEFRKKTGHQRKPDIEFPGKDKFFFTDLGYRAEWGVYHGEELWSELYKLEEWYHMRRYLQIDKFDERISMELAMVVALLSLVPKLLVIWYNFVVLSSGKSKLQAINFVTLWDFAFILVFVFRALMITLAFNDHYDRHAECLAELIEHIKMETTFVQTAVERKGGTEDMVVQKSSKGRDGPMIYQGQEAVKFVETFQTALEKFDAPASFFGMRVNRNLITGFSSTALLFFAPQIVTIVQDVCKG